MPQPRPEPPVCLGMPPAHMEATINALTYQYNFHMFTATDEGQPTSVRTPHEQLATQLNTIITDLRSALAHYRQSQLITFMKAANDMAPPTEAIPNNPTIPSQLTPLENPTHG